MARQKKYKRRTITPEWIDDVRAGFEALRLAGNKAPQRTVAKAAGCSSPAISIILKGEQDTSHLVEPISEFLGLELPPIAPITKEERDAIAYYSSLDDITKARFRDLLNKHKKQRGR